MPGVADYLIERMRASGVRAIFGLPGGGGNLDLIQAAGRAGLPFVLTATETGSAIAALAQSEITDGVGACITTLGPGAASVVNGVACAKLERARVLVVTDSYAASGAGFEHQRLDHRALLTPIVKWSGSLAPLDSHQNIDEALITLGSLPPGPVHLDCPADFDDPRSGPGSAAVAGGLQPAGSLGGLKAADYLSRAFKPLLIVGLGARRADAAEAIRNLCEKRNIPALVTYKAKGVVPDGHPCFAGVFTNAAAERAIVEQSDLLIGVGFDPVEILPRPWSYSQPIVSLAAWEMTKAHVPFKAQAVGDIVELVAKVSDLLPPSAWNLAAVRQAVEAMRDAVAGYAGSSDPASVSNGTLPLTPSRVVQLTAGHFAGASRVTVDAGAHMLPAAVLWPVNEPNGMLISNGLSTMGFALPAAIGAGLLDRMRPTVVLTGDGGLMICLGELATAVRERLKIVIIVFNDASLTLIELKQHARKLAPAGVGLGDVLWTRIAEGFGIPSWSAANERELIAALGQAAAVDGPSLIEARIDRSSYTQIMKAIRG
ncbi:MAG TPA: thiamine pyrophosphate-binding protein [Vicinamibacterales bacterium]|nr:thiamine pyrophosphate-binding protein [Vicinamibacterales bacterium]